MLGAQFLEDGSSKTVLVTLSSAVAVLCRW